jgi:ComEC/Rec2-related protein
VSFSSGVRLFCCSVWVNHPFWRSLHLLMPTLGCLGVTGYLIEYGYLPSIPPEGLLYWLILGLLLWGSVHFCKKERLASALTHTMLALSLLLLGIYSTWLGYQQYLRHGGASDLLHPHQRHVTHVEDGSRQIYRLRTQRLEDLPLVRGLYTDTTPSLTIHDLPLNPPKESHSVKQRSKGVLVILDSVQRGTAKRSSLHVWVRLQDRAWLIRHPEGMPIVQPLPHPESPAFGAFSPRIQGILHGRSLYYLTHWYPRHLGQSKSLSYTDPPQMGVLSEAHEDGVLFSVMTNAKRMLQALTERLQHRMMTHYTHLQSMGMPLWHQYFLQALVLGEKHVSLPWWLTHAYQKAGVSHWLAASGYNLTVAVGGTLLLLRALGCPTGWLVVFGWLGISVFGTLTGWPVSMIRAGTMLAVLLLCLWLYKKYHWGTPSLSRVFYAVIALLSLVAPQLWLHVGFQLSVCATWGILTLLPVGWHMTETHWPRWLRFVILPTIAAQMGVFPILLGMFQSFHWVSLPLNWLGAPIISVLTLFSWGYALWGGMSWMLFKACTLLSQLLGLQEAWYIFFSQTVMPLYQQAVHFFVLVVSGLIETLTWLIQQAPRWLLQWLPHAEWHQPLSGLQWVLWYSLCYGVSQWDTWWHAYQKKPFIWHWVTTLPEHGVLTPQGKRSPQNATYTFPSIGVCSVLLVCVLWFLAGRTGTISANANHTPPYVIKFEYPYGYRHQYRLVPLMNFSEPVNSDVASQYLFTPEAFLLLSPDFNPASPEALPWLFKRMFLLTRWKDDVRKAPFWLMSPEAPLILKDPQHPSWRLWLKWSSDAHRLYQCRWQVPLNQAPQHPLLSAVAPTCQSQAIR